MPLIEELSMKAFYVFMSFLVLILVVGFFVFLYNDREKQAMTQPNQTSSIETPPIQPQQQPLPQAQPTPPVNTLVIERDKVVPVASVSAPSNSVPVADNTSASAKTTTGTGGE